MATTYADNYEEITGKKRGEDIETGVTPAPVAESKPETKVVAADSKNVKTA